jgi:hypothetical protein
MKAIHEQLAALGAHHDLVTWSHTCGEDWQALFSACPRGDWLLALLARFEAAPNLLVPAAGRCARVAWGYLSEPSASWTRALEVAENFDGSPQAEQACVTHAAELAAAPPPIDAVEDAVRDAIAAALSSALTPESAAHAAGCAVHAAVIAAGECAVSAALRFTQERTAECVRDGLSAADFAALASAALRAKVA